MSKNGNKNSVSGQNDETMINKSKSVLKKPEDYSHIPTEFSQRRIKSSSTRYAERLTARARAK